MIIIHAGLKKAGSAAIQTFLSANEAPLRALDVHYPAVGRGHRKAHHDLAGELRNRNKAHSRFGNIADLAAYWKTAGGGVMVISSEMFEESEAAEALDLRRRLEAADPEIRVVLILRNLVQLMPSSYLQKIKFGANTYDFDVFFRKRMAERRIHYFDTARRWAEGFGWENLRVRPLDPAVLANGDLIDDFLGLVGLDAGSPAAAALSRPGEVNVSPDWRVAEAVRALYLGKHGLSEGHPLADARTHPGSYRREIGRHAFTVGEAMGWKKERGSYLTFDQARHCREIYRANVASLNGRLGEPLPLPAELDRKVFPGRAFLPAADRIPPAELQAFYDALGERHLRNPGRPIRKAPGQADAGAQLELQ